jgi:hypothetical protein
LSRRAMPASKRINCFQPLAKLFFTFSCALDEQLPAGRENAILS